MNPNTNSKSRTVLFSGRKAQITVFMIIGIILLFSSALLFYIRGQVMEGIPDEFVPTVAEVPLEAQPIKIFVEDCMKRAATSALNQMGLHSGYLDPSNRDTSGKVFLQGISPTESDGLKMMDNDKSMMPYWWHMNSPNDCVGTCQFDSFRPALRKDAGEPSIEGQLDYFIENNLATCLDNFDIFRQTGFGIDINGPIVSDARITEEDVSLFLEYPISAQKSGKKIDINRYFIRLDINFKQIYDFSTEVTNTEIQKGFLEYYVMNLIAMKSWPSSSDKIPPIADFNFDIGDRKIWTRTDVQSKLESNVLSEIDQIQFAESSNLIMRRMWKENDDGEWEYDPIGQGIWEESLFALNNTRPFNGLSVGFTYIDWWPIYLNINDQEVLMPKSMQGTNIISFFGFNQYSFWYDVSFPVMVTVHDSNAFDGKGYDFRFAIEGNIRDNNRTTPSYTSLSESSGKKFACNMNQRNSGNIKIETVDAITGKPVTGRVDFMLGDESCFIGFIELDENNHSVISAPFPIGLGSIKINNEDYLIHEEKYFTSLEQGDEMTIEMIPFKEINASIFLKSLNFNPPTNEYLLPGADIVTPVNPIKEKATLVFERVADDVISEYTAFMTVNSSTERNIIKLVPGEYNVRGFLFYTDNNNPITIPEKTLNYEVFWGDDVEITLNSTEMNPYPRGGLVFDNETGYMEITANELYGNEKVNFYMLAFPPAQVHSAALVKGKPGLEQLSEWDTYSMIYRERLLPTWFI